VVERDIELEGRMVAMQHDDEACAEEAAHVARIDAAIAEEEAQR
jgi:hypothetical protein